MSKLLPLLFVLGCTQGEDPGSQSTVVTQEQLQAEAAKIDANAPTTTTDTQAPREDVKVSGTLALGNAGGDSIASRPVKAFNTQGDVVATGTTTASGAFTLNIPSGATSLLYNRAFGLKNVDSLTVQSLFVGDQSKKAQGVKKPILFDQSRLARDENGKLTYTAGAFTVDKVGAIVGTITLDTNGDAAGIDVYVPGTTHIAKTDSNGQFLLGFLPPGKYSLRADNDGFGSIEWKDILVKPKDTTNLEDAVMRIATGPEIVDFGLLEDADTTLEALIELELEVVGASKYRISQLSDFRDVTFETVDATAQVMDIDFELSGADGIKRIYLEVADSDGLSVVTQLDVLLDTTLPVVPTYEVRSDSAAVGYTNSATPKIYMSSCDDIERIYVAETSSKPAVSDFTIECNDTAGVGTAISVSASEGAKTLYVWALDRADQVSDAARTSSLTLDSTIPTLSVVPSADEDGQILAKDTVELDVASTETGSIYYTFDLSTPTRAASSLPLTTNAGKLVLIDDATVKFMAIDLAGNQTEVLSRNVVIDRDSPYLASITTSSTVSNSMTIPVILSATGATKMKLGESISGLHGNEWEDFSTTANFTLSGVEGENTIYAAFADDAGNEIGLAGEYSVTITVDTVSPVDGRIVILDPGSPTGARDATLAVGSRYAESGLSYEFQVASDGNFDTVDRTMTTTNTWAKISPPLTSDGTYYWRVRALDQAGNASSYTAAPDAKKLVVQTIRESYRETYSFNGSPTEEQMFGAEILPFKDLNGDGESEILVSILLSTYDVSDGASCADCGMVEIFDPNTQTREQTFQEGLPEVALYGHALATCDVTADGNADIVISAPGEEQVVDSVTYRNAGAVYVYDGVTYERIGAIRPELSGEAPINGWAEHSCVASIDGTCTTYGDTLEPFVLRELPYADGGTYFGWSVECLSGDSDATSNSNDAILIGDPLYNNGTGTYGRVVQYEYDSDSESFSATETIAGPTENSEEAFGVAVRYLSDFKAPSCATVGPTLAIGSPWALVEDSEIGSFGLYQFSDGDWALCDQVEGDGEDAEFAKFGGRIFNLGNLDGSNDDSVELAVSSYTDEGGVVRIYSGTDGSVLKSYREFDDDNLNYFGYQVLAVGDMSTTADEQSDILISAPGSTVGGIEESGRVYVFEYTSLDSADNNTGTVLENLTGNPALAGFHGAAVYSMLTDDQTMADEPEGIVISRPGVTIDGYRNVGLIQDFTTTSIAPTAPERITGIYSGELLGSSLALTSDLDDDGLADFYFGRPGLLVDGRSSGGLSLLSAKDEELTSTIASTDLEAGYIGEIVLAMETSILVSSAAGFSLTSTDEALNHTDLNDSTDYPAALYFATDEAANRSVASYYDEENSRTILVIGEGDGGNAVAGAGFVTLFTIDDSSPAFTSRCTYSSAVVDAGLGTGLSFVNDLTDDGAMDLLIGAPGEGKVYIVDGNLDDCDGDADLTVGDDDDIVLGVIADDDDAITAVVGSEGAEDRFGTMVVGLEDADGSGDGLAHVVVGNMNVTATEYEVPPEYFIFEIQDEEDFPVTLARHQQGPREGNLGFFVKEIEDVNNDGKKEIAISHPAGSCTYGNTGRVDILSSAALLTTTEEDDVLQVICNPEETRNNFGSSLLYADITGDGERDFIVGARWFGSSDQYDLGAVYVFPMLPAEH